MKKSTLYVNGRIYTMDPDNTVYEAMAVEDGRIVRLGTTKELMEEMAPDQELEDLKGCPVLPGMCDCHVHMDMTGAIMVAIDAAGKGKEELLEEVRMRAQSLEKGKWITGMGWNQDSWDGKFPTKEDLDAVCPDHPVKLTRCCGHAFWCNSLALELAGFHLDEVSKLDPKEYPVNEEGKLLGVLIDGGCKSIEGVLPEDTREDTVSHFKMAEEEALRFGITAVMNKGAGLVTASSTDCGRSAVALEKELFEKEELKIRYYEALAGQDEYFDDCFKDGLHIDLCHGKFTLRSIKLFGDGAFGARSAWISRDYRDQPGKRGFGILTDEEMIRLFKRADEKNVQISIHSIGDVSIKQILDCYETAFADSLHKDRRFCIEHCHLPSDEDLARIVSYGIIFSTQFLQLSLDMDVIPGILPDALLKRLYIWRTVVEKGVIVTNGSDSPCSTMNPFESMHTAVTRLSERGTNTFEEKPYKEALTRLQALRAYTTTAAYSMFKEKELGSLECGKLADFVVTDKDYFTCVEEEIQKIRVLKTYIGGELCYSAE